MEGKIKTALERALERAQSMPEVSPEEMARLEQMPRGRSIGASFMNSGEFNLKEALSGIAEKDRKFVVEGVQEVLLMNIVLSTEEAAGETNRRAGEGLLLIKKDKPQAEAVLNELDHLLKYYRQSLEQAGERFRQEFEARNRTARRPGGRERTMERMEFREEWANLSRQINARFEAGLAGLKDNLSRIP